ncbi:MAG: hypothetical protein LBI67_12070 [Treponema sp.]|jgi:hypothetical protein|nr:hypothetical protein [Treponema sp.]
MGARTDPRYESSGRIYIAEVLDTEALLKNLSASGLCIESTEFLNITPNSRYAAKVFPEKESLLASFTVNIESKWIRTRKDRSESGFLIIVPPGISAPVPAGSPVDEASRGDLLKRYLDFLTKSSKPAD